VTEKRILGHYGIRRPSDWRKMLRVPPSRSLCPSHRMTRAFGPTEAYSAPPRLTPQWHTGAAYRDYSAARRSRLSNLCYVGASPCSWTVVVRTHERGASAHIASSDLRHRASVGKVCSRSAADCCLPGDLQVWPFSDRQRSPSSRRQSYSRRPAKGISGLSFLARTLPVCIASRNRDSL
jgi:hypothetical protein